MTRQEAVDKAVKYFEEGYACSQSVLLAFAEELKLDSRVAKLISGTFGGGMGRFFHGAWSCARLRRPKRHGWQNGSLQKSA